MTVTIFSCVCACRSARVHLGSSTMVWIKPQDSRWPSSSNIETVGCLNLVRTLCTFSPFFGLLGVSIIPFYHLYFCIAFEAQLYRKLPCPCDGVTEMLWFGREKTFNVMVMELLGKSLADLFEACGRRFSLPTVIFIALESLRRIENLHNHDIVHRDIKPNNFVIGKEPNANTVYLLDYGLAKIYRIHSTHIPYREDKKLTGTARYASLNAHLGRELSRRDDLESLGFMLVCFYKGNLPWQGNHNAKTKQEMYTAIKKVK